MAKIKIKDDVFICNENLTLLQCLRDNAVAIEAPCGGKGICGKCKIKVVSGNDFNLSDEEKTFFNEQEIVDGYRLSCIYKPVNDIEIEVPYEDVFSGEILTEGKNVDVEINPVIQKQLVKVKPPTLEYQKSYEEIFCEASGYQGAMSLGVMRQLSDCMEEILTAIFCEGHLIGIEQGDTRMSLLGVAVDIGTTTMVATLVDLNSGEQLAHESMLNPQKDYGLDVLSRIEYERSSSNGLQDLHEKVVEGINGLIEDLCSRVNAKREHIYDISVGANSTMAHYLLNISGKSLGKSPYVPVFNSMMSLEAKSIGIRISEMGRMYVVPAVSGFIGGDIVAGVMVSDLLKRDKSTLFIDIGTNGELVFSRDNALFSCSCAAGPALEGMNITSGMRAATGAIERVQIDQGKAFYKTIGNSDPRGICGSGIIELMSEVVKNGLVGKTGRIVSKGKAPEILKDYIIEDGKKRSLGIFKGHTRLDLTQNDIRQIQLAKGAILSGIMALLNSANTAFEEVENVIIAGQFGKHLSAESLIGCGIIPEPFRDKVEYIGNASKQGALMCLLSKEQRHVAKELASKIGYFELSNYENYDRLFADCLCFK